MVKKIRVLIIDDSLVSREVISRGLMTDPEINVIAKAVDAYDATDKILKFKPDIITCDIQMPKMNGIEFVKRILPKYKAPIIVVSGLNNTVFEALNAGAVDFVLKPDFSGSETVKRFIKELILKIKEASGAKVVEIAPTLLIRETFSGYTDLKLIAIGASTGGTEAISKILGALPNNLPGILIVQHIPPKFSKMFAQRLNEQTHFSVKEAETGDKVEKGKVLIAPGDKHMLLIDEDGVLKVVVKEGMKINGHCPSVDVLFESVAKVVGKKSLGVILTGMGYDGAKGLLRMKRKGAMTLGQDESSSVVYGMPKVAYEIGGVTKQVKLDRMPHKICEVIKK